MKNNLLLLILIFATSFNLKADDELYSKIFGNKEIQTKLSFIIQGKDLGDIAVKTKVNELIEIDTKTLKAKLKIILKEEKFKELILSKSWTKKEDFKYKTSYDKQDLSVQISIPLKDLRPTFYSLESDAHIKYAGSKLDPAPLSASINYIAEKSLGDEYFGGERFSVFFKNFINFHSYVFSFDGNYENKTGDEAYSRWQRSDVNLTKDIKEFRTRLQVGDTSSSRFDFMQSQRIGGISIKKEYSIDPYKKSFSQGTNEFQILRRSKVKTYVNGSLIKNEILSAGNYTLKDLPLINGINNVRLEIDDEVSPKKVLEFNIPISISIIKKGELNYSISSGKKINDSNITRDYEEEEFHSSFIQYGFTENYSLGFYAQKDNFFELKGLSQALSTSYGNLFLGFAESKTDILEGRATSVTWQYQNIAGSLLKGVSFVTRGEYFQDDFRNSLSDQGPTLENSYDLSLSFPVFYKTSLNIGTGVSKYRESENGKKVFTRSSISIHPTHNLSLNFYGSTSKSTGQEKEESLSVFATWSFGESNYYVSSYNNLKAEDSRVTLTKNNSNQLYQPRYSISYNQDTENKGGSASIDLPTPMADIYLKSRFNKFENDQYEYYSLGMSSALLFVYDDQFAFSFSKSNNGSFAIFKRTENLKEEKIKVRSTSSFADTESPLLGEPAITNLIPYQYRELQIDPTFLSSGLSLNQEKFIVQSQYKSGHLITLKDKGNKALQGKLIKNGKPISLKIGDINGVPFFTDRSGFFYINEIHGHQFKISIQNSQSETIELKNNQVGVIDIGIIQIP